MEKELEQEERNDDELEEQETPASAVTIEEAAKLPAEPEAISEPETVPVAVVALGEIAARLGETSLPNKSIAKLVVENYSDLAALDAAIEAEVTELREAGSGRPFALAESAAPKPVTVSEAEAKKDAVLEKWGFSTSPSTEAK